MNLSNIENKRGIYCIENTIDGKRYIGASYTIRDRIINHLSYFKRETHPNLHLLSAVKKYGIKNFKCYVIEYCELDVYDREIYWIALYDTIKPDKGYNMSSGGESGNNGMKHSEETKRKMSEAHKNPSEETRNKLSKVHKGTHHSDKARKKMSEAQKGRHHSDERRNKNSEAQKGKLLSKETKRKMSEAHKGKHYSYETRKKMSEAKKLYWENRRKHGITYDL